MLIMCPGIYSCMASRGVPVVVLLTFLVLSCGCTSGGPGAGAAPRPTIDDTKWVRVLDQTYVLAPPGADNDSVDVPVIPDTAYRLDTRGEVPVELSLSPDEENIDMPNGTDIEGYYITFASKALSWNGIFRTGPGQKHLGIRRVHSIHGPAVDTTTQDEHVVLDRYDGDPSIEPVTTEEEIRYSPR
jgi:hypothetical protein